MDGYAAPKKADISKAVGGAKKAVNIAKKPVESLKRQFYNQADKSDDSGVKAAKLGMQIKDYGTSGLKTAVRTGAKTVKNGSKITKRVYRKIHKPTSAELRRRLRKRVNHNLAAEAKFLAKRAIKNGTRAAGKAAANAAKTAAKSSAKAAAKAAQAAAKAAAAASKAVAGAVAKIAGLIAETMPWSLIIIAVIVLVVLIALMVGSLFTGAGGSVAGGGAWLVDDNKNETPEEIYEGYKEFVEQAKDIMQTQANVEELAKYFIRAAIRENGLDAEVGEVVLYGSRCRGMEHNGSDLDFVAEIYSDLKEDALFNILHETLFEIGGAAVDINPIRAEETGSLEDYLLGAERYLQQKGAKEKTVPEVQDYRIDETEPTSFGPKARYAANIAAIKTLNRIEIENRIATPDEQKILAQYVGWGGIPQAFDSDNAAWFAEYSELKELLTTDEYEAARSTVLTAHYT